MKKALLSAVAAFACGAVSAETTAYDLVIYGSSPSGLAAAVQAKRMGLKAVVVSPERRIGGLTTGGLGQTDIGDKRCFGGIALEFYRAVATHYRDPKAWTREKMSDYSPDGQCFGSKGVDSMWTFEPSAARQILEGWERRDGLEIVRGQRLDRSNGKVRVEGQGPRRRIVSFVTENGTEYRGKMFVDATYEGDLMAAAGVSCVVGREANAVYGETLNGIQRAQGYHKFEPKVSAYVVPDDPTSGFLPNVEPDTADPDGLGDGWQDQLYVREGRRLVGDYVMTEQNCRGQRTAPHPVAMGAYSMDSHHVRRYADRNGHVQNEGDVEVHTRIDGTPFEPYGIEYAALVPKRDECGNLFVPVCLSASHIAFGSIRMEPVFFALGQVAGTAAAIAIADGVAVQDVDYARLARRLTADGQVLTLEPPTEVTVAAVNARAFEIRNADFVCTGRNDEVVINAAIATLTRGGTVRLADGDYFIDGFANEGNSAIFFGFNDGSARTITFRGTTENKSYNTRHGVTIHVTKAAMDAMKPDETYRVFFGTGEKPKAKGDFFTYTHVNNVNFSNFFLFFADASKPLRGIDGSNFGQLYVNLVGIYTERYFQDRFLHEKPATPARGSVGVWSSPSSSDEMARVGYDWVNVGGLHTGFHFDRADHYVLRSCSAARCCVGYSFDGGPKTLTLLNCCDEGNTHLPRFTGTGHLTAIDFNIERFNADFIPSDSDGDREAQSVERMPGAWRGFLSYTLQGHAFDLGRRGFWKSGHGTGFQTVRLDERP